MKYIPSIAFEEMSGSAKGVTAAKVKNRKYIRNRGYGGSVRTTDQAKVKGVFKRLTTMWKTLPNDQILAWNKLALSQEARSVLGTKGKISGANLFTRLNYWIVACGGSPETTPPTLLGVENPPGATIVCQGDTFTFKLNQALADNGGIFLVIEATEGQSNGVSRAHSKASQIKMVEEPTAAAIDTKNPWGKRGANIKRKIAKCVIFHDLAIFGGDSYRTQTCNLLIRSQMLYSIELRSRADGGT